MSTPMNWRAPQEEPDAGERTLGAQEPTGADAGEHGPAGTLTASDLPPTGGHPGDQPPADGDWKRQNPRMFLVYPFKALGSLFPLLLLLLFTQRGDGLFQLFSAGVAGVIAVVVSLVQYFTLRYRVGAETVQVRRGLFTKETKTARLERVRSIDVEGNLLMRLLDLRTITIGTGVDDGQVELEGIRTRDAEELREGLLRRSREVRAARGIDAGAPARVTSGGAFPAGDAGALDGRDGPVVIGGGTPDAVPAPDVPEQSLVRWDKRWLRFGPLGASGLVVAGVVAGGVAQFADDIARSDLGQRLGGQLLHRAQDLGVVASIATLLAAGAVFALLFSLAAYALGWWGLDVTRSGHGTLHVRRGLATTRSATMEERKVRGVMVTEPWQQRWQKGASLSAIVTGAEGGSVEVLPTVPRDTAREVAVDVLSSGEDRPAPVGLFGMELVSHGPRALRRMTVSALLTTFWFGLLPAAVAVAVLRHFDVTDGLLDRGWWWLFAWTAFIAVVNLVPVYPAWRSLGHAVTEHHVVFRQGAILRNHLALETDGILSWNMAQSFFQRRLELCTLTATVAGGAEGYELPNVPVEDAVRLMRSASPELLGQFSRAA
ncbi:PH domain-containing protein [Kytococcus sedentarius]|uniref:PH domain-containing protein n=1 Tax=Kytococcus sedentarius TaxID=1276 RepID=UPI001950C259|nr:PH domain-containing protein [Kytococcus sedentarius]QRO87042.1 PH domain-containing protein [Kytococcus sedentarius]